MQYIYVRQKVGEALEMMLTTKSLKDRLFDARMRLIVLDNPDKWEGVPKRTKELVAKFMDDKKLTKKVRCQRFFEMVIGVFREAGREASKEE